MDHISFDDDLADLSLAYRKDGSPDEIGQTGFFWLGGFKSEMASSKAENLAELARATRRPFLRFDYSGHGQSSGLFTDGTISAWLEQAAHMFLRHTTNKRIIVGSSMGGWLALLLARKLKSEDPSAYRRIAGMVLIAPAADMTLDLMWATFSAAEKAEIEAAGVVMQPSDYGEPYAITAKLIADGQNHIVLKEGLAVSYPVRILQGTDDTDVPPSHGAKTFEALRGPDVTLTFVKGAGHRMSTAPQLHLMREAVMALALRSDGEAL